MYDVSGIPHLQWNGVIDEVGGASNCDWEAIFPSKEETLQELSGQGAAYNITLEGELDGSLFNYNVVVDLNSDFSNENQFLEIFVAQDSLRAWWSTCQDYHNCRFVGRDWLTMEEDERLPLSISLEGESEIFSDIKRATEDLGFSFKADRERQSFIFFHSKPVSTNKSTVMIILACAPPSTKTVLCYKNF
jgi:hypothetical protein